MKAASRGPWSPLQRVDALVQPEPILLLGLAVVAVWAIYLMAMRSSSPARHAMMRGALGNLSLHVALLTGLSVAYFGLDVDVLEQSKLVRVQPWLGVLLLVQGCVAFTKVAKVLAMELLFLSHMREFVPALLINTFTALVACTAASWLAANLFDLQIGPLLATSAAASVVLGLAMQDTLGNLFSGIAMQFDKPYEIGDWVEVTAGTNKWVGQVWEVTWRATALVGLGDELINIPNRVIGQGQVANFSQRGLPIARVLTMRLPLETDLQALREPLARSAHAVDGVVAEPPPAVFYSEVGDAWVSAKLVYWIADYGRHLALADQVLMAALATLRDHGVHLAVPRVHIEADAATLPAEPPRG